MIYYSLIVVLVLLFVFPLLSCEESANASNQQYSKVPIVKDAKLKVELVASGLNLSSSMAFEDESKILVLQKNTGRVLQVVNGTINHEPLIDVNVATLGERGLLGISLARIDPYKTYVFLFFTESNSDSSDSSGNTKPLGNRVYRYEMVGDKLLNPKLLLDLPGSGFSFRWADHNGGRIIIGDDRYLYIQVGDVGHHRTEAENVKGIPAVGTGGILRVNFSGLPPLDNPFAESIPSKYFYPYAYYYAYGIRNGFGMDFDPLTGKLWDTENGPSQADEINLVYPGFNSGWSRVQGIWRPVGNLSGFKIHLEYPLNQSTSDTALSSLPDMVHFYGKGKYYPPRFIWNQTVGPTALKFMSSQKLGKDYENDLFVADFHKGNIYHFKLNADRTNLILDPPLNDKIANSEKELSNITFATGFGGITDLQISPGGYLYVLTYTGEIYRITKAGYGT